MVAVNTHEQRVQRILHRQRLLGAILASAYRRSEDIGIGAIVIAELKFRNIEGQISFTHLVENADHTGLALMMAESAPAAEPHEPHGLAVLCVNHTVQLQEYIYPLHRHS
jgi:hypothetical protein